MINNANKTQKFLDSLGLCLLGAFSLGYVLLERSFAEIYIKFSFLDFPVFIGEVLIFACMIIMFVKYKFNSYKFTRNQHIFLTIYFIFVIVKAFYGYSIWGPLAFRHAALLYYPIFACFSYSFYRSDFFTNKKKLIIIGFFIAIFAADYITNYWIFTCFILAFIIIRSFSSKTFRYLICALLCIVAPYNMLFSSSRMMILSNSCALFFLVISLACLIKISKRYRALIMCLGIFLVFLSLFIFSSHNALRSVVKVNKLIEFYKYNDDVIEQRRGSYREKEISCPQLYNPGHNFIIEKFQKLFEKNEVIPHTEESRIAPEVPAVEEKSSVVLLEVPEVEEKPSGVLWGEVPAVENAGIASGVDIAEESGGVSLEAQVDVVKVRGEKHSSVFKTSGPDQSAISNNYEMEVEAPKILKEKKKNFVKKKKIDSYSMEQGFVNAAFRLFIWRDMLVQLAQHKPLLGFNFGKPLRSISLEILNWGEIEWRRDGWIAAHNSYLHIIYRAGIMGGFFITFVLFNLFKMIKLSFQKRSIIGILFCGIIINWFIAANFLLIFEVPYTAVPIWSLYGIGLAYYQGLKAKNVKS